jgi:hypothetical protein
MAGSKIFQPNLLRRKSMNLKKMLLLPLAVLAFAAVFAAPAMAQTQYHFLDNGNPIGEAGTETVTFTGPAAFENEAGGIACSTVTAKVKFTTFDADISSFTGAGCKTTGLLPAFGCELTSATAPVGTGFPWTATPESTSVADVAGVFIDNPMEPGCAFGENITAESNAANHVKLTAVTPGVIGALKLSGTLETAIGVVNVSGTVSPSKEGTITLVST